MTSDQAKKLPHGALVTYAGRVMVLQRPPTAKGVVFITLEDEVGSLDLILFKKIYERFAPLLRSSSFLIVKGRIEKRGVSISLVVGHVSPFLSKFTDSS